MSNGRLIIGIILIAIGIASITGIDLFRFIIPALLIWWGYTILTGRRIGRSSDAAITSESELNEVLIFSGTNRRIDATDFKGGKVTVVFGGADIDLTKVKTKEKSLRLELVTVFGGIRLRVPENWLVQSEATAILGGVSNKAQVTKQAAVTLRITGASIFGGIDITN